MPLMEQLLKKSAGLVSFLILASILFFGNACGPVERSDATQLKLMSFNVRRDDSEPLILRRWPNRRALLIQTINNYGPDILGVQEAFQNQKDFIKDNLEPNGSWEVFGIGREGGNLGEHCPIFFRIDKFDLLEDTTFWFSDTPNLPSKPGANWGNPTHKRICTFGRFRDKRNQRVFYVFNLHLQHKAGSDPRLARLKSVKLLLEKIRDRDPKEKFIVMGDFNAKPGSDPIKLLMTGISNGEQTFPVEIKMIDAWDNKWPDREKGTAHNWDGIATRRIDYIFLQKDQWLVDDSQIIEDNDNGIFPSDHFPMTAHILEYPQQ